MASSAEVEAMRRALVIATSLGSMPGPNPRVGCVILDCRGEVVAEGLHRGAGSPHAEADALVQAGDRVRGATAVVTLEPCGHHGRTPPCSQALIEAGVARVVFAQSDPNPAAAGGAVQLADAGIDVEGGVLCDDALRINEAWTFAVTHGRPLVTWKVAASLDGRVAANDGTSRWISGDTSRSQVHALRAQVDAIVVGTGTVLSDNPHLTVRDDSGELATRQPLRVVVGIRDVPAHSRVLDDSTASLHLATRDPAQVLATLHAREIRHVLLEGGPTLAAAFLRAGLVDRVQWYVAPVLLGAGSPAVGELGIESLVQAVRLAEVRVAQVGEDASIQGIVSREG